jgi:hypothetical protein
MKAIDGASALLALRICVRVVERFKEGFAIFVTPESARNLLHVDRDRVVRRNEIVFRCGPSPCNLMFPSTQTLAFKKHTTNP